MAQTCTIPVEPQKIPNINHDDGDHHHDSNNDHMDPMDSILAVDDEIPTVDYHMLFSDNLFERSKALNHLSKACEDYGFFYLVNHGVPENVIEEFLAGSAEFFKETKEEEKKKIQKKNPIDPTAQVMWDSNYHSGENREYIKLVTQPQLHSPPNTNGFREALEEYVKRFKEVKFGLARAISKILGHEECFIEKAFNLETGFDVTAINLYPPSSESKGSTGVPSHTDPGFVVSLIQDVNGGLRILTHTGKWINAYIPRNAFLIQVGDHLEVLTNGKYKSHLHHVAVTNNKVRRISVATLHGPALDKHVAPAPEFVDEFHPPAYRGMTYKEALEANGHCQIEVQSCLDQLRI